MSADDEITPDFNLEDVPSQEKKSTASEDNAGEQKQDSARSGTETAGEENDDKVKKLKDALGLSDIPEVKRSPKRPRSLSPSETTSDTRTSSEPSHRGKHISPTKIAKIFRNKVNPTTLCQLAAMSSGTPSDVKKLIPDASVTQICQMCELWEKMERSGRHQKQRSRSPRRVRRRSSKRRHRSRQKSASKQRRPRARRDHQVRAKVKAEPKTLEAAHPVPTPKKSL